MVKNRFINIVSYITSLMLLLSIVFCSSSCYSISAEIKTDKQRREYYADMTHYIPVTATVDDWTFYYKRILIRISNLPKEYYAMSPEHWTYFEISGDNYEIVMQNGIEARLEKGMTIEFLSAPEDFGNGYIRPIVALTLDGVVLLEQETGIENYLKTI